jgi:hypothetical protein
LIDWGLDREACKAIIVEEGLPLLTKSACYFCPATKPEELVEAPLDELRRVIVIEARAQPRLQTIDGLWRKPVTGTRGGAARPGSMTEYIRERRLLPTEEIDEIVTWTPTQLLSCGAVESWQGWLGRLFEVGTVNGCTCRH